MSPLETGTAESSTTSPDSSSKQTVICVFCGASTGFSSAHLLAARSLGETLSKHNIKLIYGGGTTGLMGEVAKTVVSRSGRDAVLGIIPKALLEHERAQSGQLPDKELYGNLEIIDDMHTRKNMMAAEVVNGGPGSGFVALSGGYGTLEELMEMTTWNTLGLHDKGIVLLNVDGYYDGLMQWKKTAVEAGFLGSKNEHVLIEAKDAEGAVKALKEYKLSEGRILLDWDQK
ncbi:MAG: hypothetical protein LQ352_007864 [Teloschistes flavicans]|nr:MAG: hypothetical protein LQ352_007864 [Teloschistes flavicans]